MCSNDWGIFLTFKWMTESMIKLSNWQLIKSNIHSVKVISAQPNFGHFVRFLMQGSLVSMGDFIWPHRSVLFFNTTHEDRMRSHAFCHSRVRNGRREGNGSDPHHDCLIRTCPFPNLPKETCTFQDSLKVGAPPYTRWGTVAWLLVSDFLDEFGRFRWMWIELVDTGMALEPPCGHQLAWQVDER